METVSLMVSLSEIEKMRPQVPELTVTALNFTWSWAVPRTVVLWRTWGFHF